MEITLPSVRRPTILVVEPPMSMPKITSIVDDFPFSGRRPLGFRWGAYWMAPPLRSNDLVYPAPWLS